MFTGIITDIGSVLSLDNRKDLTIRVGTKFDTTKINIGASIACHGVCLTVVEKGLGWFSARVSNETLERTNIGRWVLGTQINLEASLKVGDELGGHIVSGHIDGVGVVEAFEKSGQSTKVEISAPDALAKFIAYKGSIALNGTSLTINEVTDKRFKVNLISHTKSVTTWGQICVGDLINIEVDLIARYVMRLHDCR